MWILDSPRLKCSRDLVSFSRGESARQEIQNRDISTARMSRRQGQAQFTHDWRVPADPETRSFDTYAAAQRKHVNAKHRMLAIFSMSGRCVDADNAINGHREQLIHAGRVHDDAPWPDERS